MHKAPLWATIRMIKESRPLVWTHAGAFKPYTKKLKKRKTPRSEAPTFTRLLARMRAAPTDWATNEYRIKTTPRKYGSGICKWETTNFNCD